MDYPTQSSVCFHESEVLRRDGKISYEQHVRNALSHLFTGVRHSPGDNGGFTDGSVQSYINREPMFAAIHLCILSGDFKPLSRKEDIEVEDTLVKMLASIKDITLSELQAMDSKSVSVLKQPIFYQLLVCIALDQGNRKLVREMVASGAPGPKFELLFSPPTLSYGPRFRSFYQDLTIDGQVDNGCELYMTMIENGWALPREYMIYDAASNANAEVGFKLIEILVEHNIKVDDGAIRAAVSQGQLAMLERLLPITGGLPSDPKNRHILLKYAAARKTNAVDFLEFFFKHGINDINWTEPPPLKRPNIRDEIEMPPLPATVLHKAAESGEPATVEWLINHGAERAKNYLGYDQVQVAKGYGREDNLMVFQRHTGWELAVEKESCCCSIL